MQRPLAQEMARFSYFVLVFLLVVSVGNLAPKVSADVCDYTVMDRGCTAKACALKCWDLGYRGDAVCFKNLKTDDLGCMCIDDCARHPPMPQG